jgi:hypothetical protein
MHNHRQQQLSGEERQHSIAPTRGKSCKDHGQKVLVLAKLQQLKDSQI